MPICCATNYIIHHIFFGLQFSSFLKSKPSLLRTRQAQNLGWAFKGVETGLLGPNNLSILVGLVQVNPPKKKKISLIFNFRGKICPTQTYRCNFQTRGLVLTTRFIGYTRVLQVSGTLAQYVASIFLLLTRAS